MPLSLFVSFHMWFLEQPGEVSVVPTVQIGALRFRGEVTQLCMAIKLLTPDLQAPSLMLLPLPSIFLGLKCSHLSIQRIYPASSACSVCELKQIMFLCVHVERAGLCLQSSPCI